MDSDQSYSVYVCENDQWFLNLLLYAKMSNICPFVATVQASSICVCVCVCLYAVLQLPATLNLRSASTQFCIRMPESFFSKGATVHCWEIASQPSPALPSPLNVSLHPASWHPPDVTSQCGVFWWLLYCSTFSCWILLSLLLALSGTITKVFTAFLSFSFCFSHWNKSYFNHQ